MQLVLPAATASGTDALDAAIDRVRDRFGTTAVTRASISDEGSAASRRWLMPE